MLNKLIIGLENYLWGKVVGRMMGRVSALEGRTVEVGEVIDVEPIVSEALPESVPKDVTAIDGPQQPESMDDTALFAHAESLGWDTSGASREEVLEALSGAATG